MPHCLFRALAPAVLLGGMAAAQSSTTLLRDIRPGNVGSSPEAFFSSGRSTVFLANDGIIGREPWITDGTPAGTRLLRDLIPGNRRWAQDTAVAGGVFYVSEGGAGPRLWISDGTTAGTVPLKTFGGLGFLGDAALGESLVFPAAEAATGQEPWEASPSGAVLLADIVPGTGSSFPLAFTRLGDRVFFGTTAGTGARLWMTDGTPAGTGPVPGIPPGVNAVRLTAVGDRLFAVLLAASGAELWVTDGTAAGTVRIGAYPSRSFNPMPMHPFGDRAVFWGFDSAGMEPWISDGTAAGTRRIGDLNPGSDWSWVHGGFATVGDRVLFAAYDGNRAPHLYSSDGNTATKVVPLALGSEPTTHAPFVELHTLARDLVVIELYSSAGTFQLWGTDGTAAGMTLLAGSPFSFEPQPSGGRLLIQLPTATTGLEPHVLDIGALAHRADPGCGTGTRTPVLEATRPVLGGNLVLSGSRGPSGGVGLIVAGALPATAVALPGPCVAGIEPTTAAIWAAVPSAAWTWTIPVPNRSALDGLSLAVQVPCLTGQGYELSNTVHLRLGR